MGNLWASVLIGTGCIAVVFYLIFYWLNRATTLLREKPRVSKNNTASKNKLEKEKYER